uniref:CBS domain-containing protein n=1 Tax=Paenibacillus psychroresistens TaxID=1778678 RepID=UPI0038657C51
MSGLPIVNERNEIVAYISDGDIMRYIGKKHMTMGEKKIKKVPVERQGVLVGIISRGDVIRHVFKQFID